MGELVDVAAQPAAVVKGNDIKMAVELNVTNSSGVGEFRLSIDGPGSATPLSQSFFLEKGVPEGEQMIAVTLTVQDGQDDQGFPKTFEPGTYNYTFHVCQGECGSKHPHSKDFGRLSGTFEMTGPAPTPPPPPSPSPTPAPTPPSCMEHLDQRDCEGDSEVSCRWCDDWMMCQESFMPCMGNSVAV